MSRGFFDTVVASTGLSTLFAAPVVQRACEMAGLEPEHLEPREIDDLLPALRKGLTIFLPNEEANHALRRMEGLRPRPAEEIAPAP